MELWRVTIETKVTRHVDVPAATAAQARDRAGLRLRAGERMASAVPLSELVADPDATTLLRHLSSRAYLDHDGQSQLLQDWLLRARDPATTRIGNEALAMAGMRVLAPALPPAPWLVAVVHPSRNHVLADWLQGTCWASLDLFKVLTTLPGATRSRCSRYFAGV